MPTKLFVANWKMNKSFAQEIDFCIDHLDGLRRLSSASHTHLVICPSFPSIFSIAEILQDTLVEVGAQQCSSHKMGAYTGQVSAQSLHEAGCTYCIVGHSEQRTRGITNQEVADQIMRLFENEITPIICIGETKDEYDKKETFNILHQQLAPILPIIKDHEYVIAYEPIWSIGTGLIPDQPYLTDIYSGLRSHLDERNTRGYRLLYGGSIDEHNVGTISRISGIDGFLIGGASLDFQKLEKIVSLGT